jgi:hypothetical protein
MKTKIKIEREVEIKTLAVMAKVRYWEAAIIDGVTDDEGTLTPCAHGDYWNPIIDIDTGKITNWELGTEAFIHFKVCDSGVYSLRDETGKIIHEIDGYVPGCMSPGGIGYSDYIIMKIGKDGLIENWKFDPEIFLEE